MTKHPENIIELLKRFSKSIVKWVCRNQGLSFVISIVGGIFFVRIFGFEAMLWVLLGFAFALTFATITEDRSSGR